MSGREIVEQLERDFQWATDPILVPLSRAQITGLLCWMNAPHTRQDWDFAMREGQLAMASAFRGTGTD